MDSKGYECQEWIGHITGCAERLRQLADEKQCRAWMDFNGTELYCYPGESPAAVTGRWDRDREAQQAAYLASPEYKTKRRHEIARQIDELKKELETLR